MKQTKDQVISNQAIYSEIIALADEIIMLARNALLMHLRFLDSAFVAFEAVGNQVTETIVTDGQHFFYNPLLILKQYKNDRGIIGRNFLHVTLHCVFQHLFIGKKVNTKIWDLACDLAVEGMILEFALSAIECERKRQQVDIINGLKEKIEPFTAEKIYSYLNENPLEEVQYHLLKSCSYCDDHSIWYENGETENGDAKKGLKSETNNSESNESNNSSDKNRQLNDENRSDQVLETRSSNNAMVSGSDSLAESGRKKDDGGQQQSGPDRQQIEKQWQDISDRINLELSEFSDHHGQSAGDLIQHLKKIKKERYDYGTFLQRFSVMGENMEVNDDEFDYLFYHYGITHYRNMPLIEPLEYREIKKIRDFVIAIDTSESVSGELVQTFMTKTYNILKQQQYFFSQTTIHVLQCSATINQDTVITCEEDFDQFINNLDLYGFGGTDFRPVFEYVDHLIASKELNNFQGLIYFTDGFGEFPSQKPDYDAAFVFIESEREIPELPLWAISFILSKEEIELF